MSNSKDPSEKLGHDPLEWLASDDADVDDTPSTEQALPEPEPEPEPEPATSDIFVLPASITVQHVESIHADLINYVQQPLENATIDAQHVDTIDSSGYQLLVSLVKTCNSKGLPCRVEHPSATLVSKLKALGDELLHAHMD
jgi:anti-anti-sigma regulatory factor